MSFVIVACRNVEATNAEVEETQTQEQEVKQEQVQQMQEEEEEIKVANLEDIDIYSQDATDYKYFFLFNSQFDVGYRPNRTNLEPFESRKKYTFDKDVNIYDNTGLLSGYVKSGETITSFMNKSDEYASFLFETDEDPSSIFIIKLEDIPNFTEEATDIEYSDAITTIKVYDSIGGAVPRTYFDAEVLQKFVDDDNYYTPEEFWSSIKEQITTDAVEVFENKEEFEKKNTYFFSMRKDEEFDKYTIEDLVRCLSDCEEYYIKLNRAVNESCEWTIYGK